MIFSVEIGCDHHEELLEQLTCCARNTGVSGLNEVV